MLSSLDICARRIEKNRNNVRSCIFFAWPKTSPCYLPSPKQIWFLSVGSRSKLFSSAESKQVLKTMASTFGTRWKYCGAKEFALQNPISELYKQLQMLPPLKSFLAHNSVILHCNLQHSDLLNRACFGRPILSGPQSSIVPYGISWSPDINQDVEMERKAEETFIFELGLEEAFYLCFEIKCMHVHCNTKEGNVRLQLNELWMLMQKEKQGFMQRYKAYSHLRNKYWVVRPGLQYGANFVAYRHHPAQVHSEYAVIVLPASNADTNMHTWSHLQGLIRLCGSVAKVLLFLHIIPQGPSVDTMKPECLEAFYVHEVEVKRWIPEKHREEICVCEPPLIGK